MPQMLSYSDPNLDMCTFLSLFVSTNISFFNPTLTAFTGVANAHGPPWPHPTACRSPTCSLMTSTGSNRPKARFKPTSPEKSGVDGGANFLNANQGSAHASAHLFLIHFSYSFVIRSFVFSMSFSICFIPSAHKERSLHSFMAYGKSLCSWIIEKEEEGGRRQCDQIGRFIGLWATFRAFGNN